MANGIKFLVTGVERTGKSTLTSKIEDAFVIALDAKKYPFKVPHWNVNEYNGIDEFIDELNGKIEAYHEKFEKYPKTIVFDTVTQLYTMIIKNAMARYTGFDVHSTINKETLRFNDYVENTLISNGINVVVVAHVIYDTATSRYVVPATGAFKDTGSWLSIVDNSSFIMVKNSKFHIYHTDMKYPCRTTLEDMPSDQAIEEYDINTHLAALMEIEAENEEFSF